MLAARYTTLVVTLLLSVPVLAQTDSLQQVVGTNVYLLPPEGFAPSENFKGFQDPEDPTSMIMVLTIPGPFSAVSEGFKPELMTPRGMTLVSKDTFYVGDYPGWLLEVEQPANGLDFVKHILVYGDSTFTGMVNGVFLREDAELGEQLRKSVRSVSVKSAEEVDPRAALGFTVDESTGGLKYGAVMGNGLLLSRDGKFPTESTDKTMMIIDKSYREQDLSDRETFSKLRLRQLPGGFEFDEERGLTYRSLDGLDGYELFGTNQDDPVEELYLLILFEEAGFYYILVGMYPAGDEKALRDVRTISTTFTRR